MTADTRIGSLEMPAMKYAEMATTMECKGSGTISTITNVTMETKGLVMGAVTIAELKKAGIAQEVQQAEKMYAHLHVVTGCITIESIAMMEIYRMVMDALLLASRSLAINAQEGNMNGRILATRFAEMAGMWATLYVMMVILSVEMAAAQLAL